MFSTTKAITIGTLSLLLAACGGGGGGGDDADTTGNSETGDQQAESPQTANPNALPPEVTNENAPVVTTPPATTPPPTTEPAWTLTDLSAVMGEGSEPKAINDNGDIVGETTDPNTIKIPAYIRPFVLRSGQSQVTYLGSLGGDYGYTVGINNTGQIAGSSYTQDYYVRHAFSYLNGQMVDIGAQIGTGSNWAAAINQNGDIAILDESNKNAYLLSNGTMRLVSGAKMSYIAGMNDSGRMVGISSESFPYQAAAYYDGNTTILLSPLPGGASTFATDINNAGTVIGISYDTSGGPFRSFIYENGSMREISAEGETGISATDINEAGDIVGWARTPDGYGKAFLYRNGQMTDLNSLPGLAGAGWTLQSALKINNNGQILVSGSYNGERRFALLTPP